MTSNPPTGTKLNPIEPIPNPTPLELAKELVERWNTCTMKVHEDKTHYAIATELISVTAERDALREAISWALGEEGSDFRPRLEGEGPYYWRTELRRRAALKQPAEGDVTDPIKALADKQVPLGSEFQKVLDDNLSELLVRWDGTDGDERGV